MNRLIIGGTKVLERVFVGCLFQIVIVVVNQNFNSCQSNEASLLQGAKEDVRHKITKEMELQNIKNQTANTINKTTATKTKQMIKIPSNLDKMTHKGRSNNSCLTNKMFTS